MKMYIGTKAIYAEPAIKCDGKVYSYAELIPRSMTRIEGYKVVYPDGYESFSPKDVFEKAYMEVITNDKLPTTEPSISQEMVDNFIKSVDVITMGDRTTIVKATLINNFEIVKSSSCVSVENYSEEIGKEICMKQIKNEVWYLLGFLLCSAVNGIK